MHYDLPLLTEMCTELGLTFKLVDSTLDVFLEPGVSLRFTNYVENNSADCACGFVGTDSHSHGEPLDFYTDDASVELSSVDVLTGLLNGTVLVWERWSGGELQDRCLVHRDFHDDYKYLAPGEEYRVRRLAVVRDLRHSA